MGDIRDEIGRNQGTSLYTVTVQLTLRLIIAALVNIIIREDCVIIAIIGASGDVIWTL